MLRCSFFLICTVSTYVTTVLHKIFKIFSSRSVWLYFCKRLHEYLSKISTVRFRIRFVLINVFNICLWDLSMFEKWLINVRKKKLESNDNTIMAQPLKYYRLFSFFLFFFTSRSKKKKNISIFRNKTKYKENK